MDCLANHPMYYFWQTVVFVIFAGGPVLILVPGPGLALNGLVDWHVLQLSTALLIGTLAEFKPLMNASRIICSLYV